ncbi:translation initiation factor IF-2-like [Phacochoerus africanus]|uniref:translation initiation factor IF-2-like n=1 Tax=Phacochoerus africanus TaxID=41426 RepID=UPI001FD8896C|nr:translation initiation factor IF-2-like [Phacochoerus africanus]
MDKSNLQDPATSHVYDPEQVTYIGLSFATSESYPRFCPQGWSAASGSPSPPKPAPRCPATGSQGSQASSTTHRTGKWAQRRRKKADAAHGAHPGREGGAQAAAQSRTPAAQIWARGRPRSRPDTGRAPRARAHSPVRAAAAAVALTAARERGRLGAKLPLRASVSRHRRSRPARRPRRAPPSPVPPPGRAGLARSPHREEPPAGLASGPRGKPAPGAVSEPSWELPFISQASSRDAGRRLRARRARAPRPGLREQVGRESAAQGQGPSPSLRLPIVRAQATSDSHGIVDEAIFGTRNFSGTLFLTKNALCPVLRASAWPSGYLSSKPGVSRF